MRALITTAALLLCGIVNAQQVAGGAAGVTSLQCGTGLSGGTVTTTGVCAVLYGSSVSTAAQGNDTRFPASVTGLRLGGGLGSADTAQAIGVTGAVVPLLNGNNTFSGNDTFSAAGAASIPGVYFNGTPFAGTATTTKAQVLIEVPGATSTGWGSAGNVFGINCGSMNNFLFNFQQNAVARMSLTCGGAFTIPSGTANWSGTYNFSSAAINFTSLLESTIAPGSGGLGGFGTTPLVVNPNGTAAFDVNVGTGTVSTTGTITMPAATHHWTCKGTDANNPTTIRVEAWGTSATSVSVATLSQTTGLAMAATAGDVIQFQCGGV